MENVLFRDDFGANSKPWICGIGGGVGAFENRGGACHYTRGENRRVKTPAYYLCADHPLGRVRRVTCEVQLCENESWLGVLGSWGFRGGWCLRLTREAGGTQAVLQKSGLLSAGYLVNQTSAVILENEAGQWHRVVLETGIDCVRALVDGREVFSCPREKDVPDESAAAGLILGGGDSAFRAFRVEGTEEKASVCETSLPAPAVFSCADFSRPGGGCRYWVFDRKNPLWRAEPDGSFLCTAGPEDSAEAYLHCFEKNPETTFRLELDSPLSQGREAGIVLRMLQEACYVRLVLDDQGIWWVRERRGIDFPESCQALSLPPPPMGRAFTLRATLSGTKLSAELDGAAVCADVSFVESGRIGVYSRGAGLRVLGVEAVLPHGETVRDGVTAVTAFPEDYANYIEFTRLPDQKLLGVHSGRVCVGPPDGGWLEPAGPEYAGVNREGGYSTLLKTESGYLQVLQSTVVEASEDLKTWRRVGRILPPAEVQDEQGRQLTIFHAASMTSVERPGGKTRLFMPIAVRRYDGDRILGHYTRIFFSDDGGASWRESRTDTRALYSEEELAQNASMTETKVIACGDGRLRLYGSRSQFGCLCCLESFDGGETFGPLVRLNQWPCAMSSFGVDRDRETGVYYLAYVKNHPYNQGNLFPRTDLVLLSSPDGMNWHQIMTLDRVYPAVHPLSHQVGQILDPSVRVYADLVIVGYGRSTRTGGGFHNEQRACCVVLRRDCLAKS